MIFDVWIYNLCSIKLKKILLRIFYITCVKTYCRTKMNRIFLNVNNRFSLNHTLYERLECLDILEKGRMERDESRTRASTLEWDLRLPLSIPRIVEGFMGNYSTDP